MPRRGRRTGPVTRLRRDLGDLERRVGLIETTTDRQAAESEIQLKRIAQLQAELDQIKRAWGRVRLGRRR